MIFQRGPYWAVSGSSVKYATREEAEAVASVLIQKEEARKLAEEQARKAELQEKLDRINNLDKDSTPYEIMIEKNICKLCNLEPCECFTYIKRTEPG
jgi:hypothetical protein